MDPLDFLEDKELLRFFHVHKTVMSCMENPYTFISQLRDHDLIPEDRYQVMSRMKSKDKLKKTLYEVLDWLEKERSRYIKKFWSSVFKDIIMNHYPILRELRKALMDGSFHFGSQVLEKLEDEETDKRKRKDFSEDEEEQAKKANSAKRMKKQRNKSVTDENGVQAGRSSPSTPSQKKKSRKVCFSSPLKKGEKSDIWTWAIYKFQLPVTCGNQKGTLNRDKLAKGEKCIVVDKQWFTPSEFERFGGRGSHKNWKLSIRCMDTPLGKLLEDGHLKSVRCKRRTNKTKKTLFPSNHLVTVSDEEEEEENEESDQDNEDQLSARSRGSSTDDTDKEETEQPEQQPWISRDSRVVFRVTCGALTGTLHKKRFASGTSGKSIRTETSWMTPVEFIKEASSGQTDPSWRKDIRWEGKPLSALLEANILNIHSLLCICALCKPDSNELENQKNDDECCICRSEEEEELVVCDQCPRSFHQKCHLPHVGAAMLRDESVWMCTFCVFRSNREWYYHDELKREAAMSRQISQHLLECQYLLLRLCSADEEQTFAKDPNLYLKDYSSVIKTPMWLGKIADKLQQQLYKIVGEFVSDVQLIFTNCASYNRENTEFLTLGNTLKKLFDGEFKTVFNIHD